MNRLPGTVTKPLFAVGMLALTTAFTWGGFTLLQQWEGSKVLMTLTAVLWGLGAVCLGFFSFNSLAEALPRKVRGVAVAAVFAGPALILVLWALVGPTLRTLWLSLFDATGSRFMGLDNYMTAFTDPIMVESFRNNLLWMVFGTGGSVGLGLLIAVFADKSRHESVYKAFIFMPMAISFVGAGVIWKFMYAYKGEGINMNEIGLLNALVIAMGGKAEAWLQLPFWNNFFLIAIMVWLQTGYAMVIISSAIKAVPDEILEAARVDGAHELTIFSRILIPSIAPTLVTVATTIVIFSLKLFDVVRVMTGGNFGTNVIANEFYQRQFTTGETGQAAAIAIVLLVVIAPVLAYNLKEFNARKVLK